MSQKVNQQFEPLVFKAGWSTDLVLLRDSEVRDLVGVSVNGVPPQFRNGETLEKAMLVQVRCGGCGIVAVVEQWSTTDRDGVLPVFVLEYQLLQDGDEPGQMSVHQVILRRELTDLRTQCSVHRDLQLDAGALLHEAGLAEVRWRRDGDLSPRRLGVSPARSA
ncbi:MAG: hypothetical protein ACR2I7_10200 [Geodermatophilaceae bacterium]